MKSHVARGSGPASTSRAQRQRGAVWGLAWGDALGCPVEGWREEQIAAYFGRYPTLPDAYPLEELSPSTRRQLRPLGLHSDDTQQALALLAVCLAPAGFSPEAWGVCLVEGARRQAWRGTGPHFERALEALARGVDPRAAGSPSAGIGAAMRVAPLGGLYCDDAAALAWVATEASAVTHGDVRALALAYAVAWCAAAFVRGESVEAVRAALPGAVREEEARWLGAQDVTWRVTREAGHAVSESLGALLASPVPDFASLRARLAQLARGHLTSPIADLHPNQGFVLLGGLHAVGMALWPEAEPHLLLSEVVRQGYDTDTVAAILGGLLGARLGDSWVPKARLVGAELLGAYAEALVRRDGPLGGVDGLLTLEASWTQDERRFQQGLLG